jgi:hypothetical protein
MSSSKLVQRGKTQRRIHVEIVQFSSTVFILDAHTPPNPPCHPISFPVLQHHNTPFSPINHPLLQPMSNQHDPSPPCASLAQKSRHPQLSPTHGTRVFAANTYRTPHSGPHDIAAAFYESIFILRCMTVARVGFVVRWRGAASRDAWVKAWYSPGWEGDACRGR